MDEIILNSKVDFIEADTTVEAKEGGLPKFHLLAYTGGKMVPSGWKEELVVDISGVQISSQKVPVRYAHDSEKPIGHTEEVTASATDIQAKGVVSRTSPWAEDVVKAGKSGYPWQASVGLSITAKENVGKGKVVQVNGQSLEGPFVLVSKSKLKEISIVELGADENTVAQIAAQTNTNGEMKMENEVKVEATLTEAQEVIFAARKEEARKESILGLAKSALKDGACVDKVEKLMDNALKDESVKASSFERDLILLGRPTASARIGGKSEITDKVIEASLAMSAGLSNVEKAYDEKTLEAASKSFKQGLSLTETVDLFARRNGFSGSSRDVRGLLTHAFDGGRGVQAAFSTMSLPGILSNVANKFLLEGYMAVENTWERLAEIRTAKDFKQMKSYRLTGDMKFAKVSPAGELPHGAVDELDYTNQIDTYGKMFSITRQDLINDDLGALTAIPRKIGRGGAIALNQAFWTELLDDAAFFTSGNGNYEEGAGTAFGLAGLSSLDKLFLDQTDADGNPLGVSPRILLVPNALRLAAKQLINSTVLINGSTTIGAANPLAGAYEVVSSSYLTNDLAYYLFANPAEVAAIQVAFLNGNRTPIVEDAQADFNVLGIQMRGYFDFGIAKQDFRGAAKSKGAA